MYEKIIFNFPPNEKQCKHYNSQIVIIEKLKILYLFSISFLCFYTRTSCEITKFKYFKKRGKMKIKKN